MIQIYHNNRCGKSRAACQILTEKGIAFETIDYLNNIPTAKELKKIIGLLGISAHDLIRTGEEIYKSLYKNKTLSDEQWIEAMVKHPILIERPIIIHGKKAVIGRPPEKVLEII